MQLLRRIQFDVLCFDTIPALGFCFGIDLPKPCAETIIGLWRGIQDGALGLFTVSYTHLPSVRALSHSSLKLQLQFGVDGSAGFYRIEKSGTLLRLKAE